MRAAVLTVALTVATASAIAGVAFTIAGAARNVDAATSDARKYHTLCRGVGLTIELAASDARRGDREGAKRGVFFDYNVIQGCATTPPVDTDARDACWVVDDMACLSRELRKIAEQLPRGDQ